MMDEDLPSISSDLPEPIDDGATDHLLGLKFPDIKLVASNGRLIDVSNSPRRTVIYVYPRTGVPDEGVFYEGWKAIPGASGCTPQSCSFRDHYQELQDLGVDLFGLSTQDSKFQQEAVERLHLPFAMLSDEKLELTEALNLPTFEVNGMTLIKRLTLVVQGSEIEQVFYPVFPPGAHAEVVVKWLKGHLSR